MLNRLLETGLPFHVKMAKSYGATREEIISAVLVGLPVALATWSSRSPRRN